MSSVSQTPLRRPLGFAFRMAVAAVAAVVVGMAPAARYLPHAPDLALYAGLPLTIQLQIAAAVGALVLGAVLMLVRKGRLFHRAAGWVWVSLAGLVVGTSIFITELNNGAWSLVHLFTGWTLIVLPSAVMWAKRHDVARHRRTMMGLFYGGFAINMFIAFIPGRTMWNMFFG